MSQLSDVKTTAKEGAQTVFDSAGQQASTLMHDTSDQLRDLLSEAKIQAREVSVRERDRLSSVLSTFNTELEQMAHSGTGGYATQLAQQLLEKSRSFQRSMSGADPDGFVQGVGGYARRRPGMFLAGAAVAGFAVGRVVRSRQSASAKLASTAPPVPVVIPVSPIDDPVILTDPFATQSSPLVSTEFEYEDERTTQRPGGNSDF